MAGEGSNRDYKLHFDPEDPKAKTKLVKHIVALANSGGGEIVFGRDETSSPGISAEVSSGLDSASLTDYIEKYVEKGSINIHHDFMALPNGNVLVAIRIEPWAYPVVMVKDGTWSGIGKQDPLLFYKGDIWVRHGSNTERIIKTGIRAIV